MMMMIIIIILLVVLGVVGQFEIHSIIDIMVNHFLILTKWFSGLNLNECSKFNPFMYKLWQLKSVSPPLSALHNTLTSFMVGVWDDTGASIVAADMQLYHQNLCIY